MFKTLLKWNLVLVTMLSLAAPATLMAAKPQLDSGVEIAVDKPYENAQVISDVFSNKAIYGKLEGTTPIDIYKFTADKDGEQTFSLMVRKEKVEPTGQPVLIFVDPTTATTAEELGLPLPSDEYHTLLLATAPENTIHHEPYLLQQYQVLNTQKLSLQKDKTYYLVVLDPYRQADRYALRLGEGAAWTAPDFFSSLPTWFAVETDWYAGTSPFEFNLTTVGLLILLLGLTAYVGLFIVQETFAFLANKSAKAGYLLRALQPFSRVIAWVGVWFMLIGGYIYFDKQGWTGIPFILGLLVIPLVVALTYQTWKLSPAVSRLAINEEGKLTIPFSLRKRWFFTFLVSLLSLGAILVFLAMYLIK